MSRFNENLKDFTRKYLPLADSIVLITHDSCNDGNACELVLRNYCKLNNPGMILNVFKRQYNTPLDIDVEDQIVVIADFSYDLETMMYIEEHAKAFIMIDHHESSLPLMESFPDNCYSTVEPYCGAELLYMLLNGEHTVRPSMLDYIGDRDVWRWLEPDSKEVNAYLSMYIKDMNKLTELYNLSDTEFINTCLTSGGAIAEYQTQHINKVVNSNKIKLVNWGKYEVPFINTTTLISEIGNELAMKYPFAIMYFITGTEIVFSFRSTSINLPSLGVPRGHKFAAGRSISLNDINLNYLLYTKEVGTYLTLLFNALPNILDSVFEDTFNKDKLVFLLEMCTEPEYVKQSWSSKYINFKVKLTRILQDLIKEQTVCKRNKDLDPTYTAVHIRSAIITHLNHLLYPNQPEGTDSGNGGYWSHSDSLKILDVDNELIQIWKHNIVADLEILKFDQYLLNDNLTEEL